MKSSARSSVRSDDLNAYYHPEFCKNLLRISKQFPLWSNVMLEYFKSPYSTATSAPVEGDFSELKNKILRHDFKPMTADRFVITHLNSLKSSMTIARNEQLFSKTSEKELEDNYEYPKAINIKQKSRSLSCSSGSSNNTIQPDSWMDFCDDQNDQIVKSEQYKSDYNSQDLNFACDTMSHSSRSSTCSFESVETLKEQESWMGLKKKPNGPFSPKKKNIYETIETH